MLVVGSCFVRCLCSVRLCIHGVKLRAFSWHPLSNFIPAFINNRIELLYCVFVVVSGVVFGFHCVILCLLLKLLRRFVYFLPF